MGKWAPLAAISVAVLALAGCEVEPDSKKLVTSAITPPNPPDFVPGLPKGYQCPLVPNGFDPAGSIYRLDKNGTYYRVKDFSTDSAVMGMGGYRKDVPISNYVLSDKQASNAGLSYSLLEKVLPGLSSSGSADFNKKVSVDITVQDITGEVIDDMLADHIVDWFKKNITPKRGSKYYLVRETVKAGAVSYRLKQKDLAKLGGKAKLEQLAEGSANVTIRDNDGTFEIKQKFSPDRIAVCIKSAEIVIDTKKKLPWGAVNISLKSSDETKVPTIKRVGAD